MNKMLYFLGGLLAGGALGAYIYKVMVSDKKIDDLEYEMDTIRRENKSLKEKLHVFEDCEGCYYMCFYKEHMTEKRKNKPAEEKKEKEEEPDKVSYHKIYNDKKSEEKTDPEIEEDDETNDYIQFHDEHLNDPPQLISSAEREDYLSRFEGYIDCGDLNYYTYDCVVADAFENELEEPEELVGGILKEFDFADSDEDVIYVFNYALDIIYTIAKIEEAYYDEH